ARPVSPLEVLIHELIKVHGPIDVATYMTLALTHPVHGYYRTGDPLGSDGDFVTAPEISQVFGELIGLCLADFWIRSDRPNPFRLVECGPGRGTLLGDLLRATSHVDGFHDALRLHLVEINLQFRGKQAAAIRRVNSAIEPTWHDDLGQLGSGGPLLVVANEFVDVLPIRQYVRTKSGLVERRISTSAAGELVFLNDQRSLDPADMDLDEVPPGSIVEISPAREAFVARLATLVGEHGGLALLIDYAHDGETVSRRGAGALGDTFQAIHQGKKTSPLAQPGSSDLTARVDFSALAQTATASGAISYGPVGQGRFLRELGIDARHRGLIEAAPERAGEVSSAIERLVDPEMMGELFQVLAITAPVSPFPAGFGVQESRA
ncbi:MAG: SAM-dependent methyltransferase, partial [Pseudomonadota bacterium]